MITAKFALESHKELSAFRQRISDEICAVMEERCSVEIKLKDGEKRFLTYVMRELREKGFAVQHVRRNVISDKAVSDMEVAAAPHDRLYYIALNIRWNAE